MSEKYIGRGDCIEAEARRQPHDTCPRCEEVPGAGVCPAPESLADFMLLFNMTFILCYRSSCKRHNFGYWPEQVHNRMIVFDGEHIDKQIASILPKSAVRWLGLLQTAKSVKVDDNYAVRHRVKALLSTLDLVHKAQQLKLPHSLIMEGDVRPVPQNALSTADIVDMRSILQSKWSVIRPSGYFFDFSHYRKKRPTKCPAKCMCQPLGTKRACLVRAPFKKTINHTNYHMRCDVRDTVAFAVHRNSFPHFLALRERVWNTLSNPSSYTLNSSYGLSNAMFNQVFPWFDKWLPANFDNIFILPSIVVQQIKQGDEQTSRDFRRVCFAKNRRR